MIAFPEVPAGEPVVVSATTYLAFSRCPASAVARLQGHYPPETKASFRGGLAHRIFARHLSSGPIADEGFPQTCREEIGSGLNPKLSAVGLRPSELRGVIEEVGELYRRFVRVAAEGFRGAEVYLEAEPAAGVTLRGSIDAVFDGAGPTPVRSQPLGSERSERAGSDKVGHVRLVDWKTGGLHEADRQLAFYSLLWCLAEGSLPARVEAVSVATGERIELEPSVTSVQRTASDVARLVAVLREAFAGRQALQQAGPWCASCPVSADCPEGVAAAVIWR